MIKSKKLSKFQEIKHGFFNRKGGVSIGIYKSLNCGIGSYDTKKNIINNLKIVCKKIETSPRRLVLLNQVHSNKCYFIKKNYKFKKRIKGDALITDVKNIAIGVLTADCVPILFYDPQKKISGCVHSGWKGCLTGILKETINKLIKIDCRIEDLIFAIGPCIKKENYEVGDEFYKKFIYQDKKNEFFFEKFNSEKYIFDLRGFINKEISNLNIKNVENIEMDTFSEKNFFYSYRRSCIDNEKDYGRCISVILMT